VKVGDLVTWSSYFRGSVEYRPWGRIVGKRAGYLDVVPLTGDSKDMGMSGMTPPNALREASPEELVELAMMAFGDEE